MIALPDQTDALRINFGIAPEQWRELAMLHRTTMCCYDFALIAMLKIAVQTPEQDFRIREMLLKPNSSGFTRNAYHVYLTDEQRKLSFNNGITWPAKGNAHYDPANLTYPDYSYSELQDHAPDITGWACHTALEQLSTSGRFYDPAAPKRLSGLYDWLGNQELYASLMITGQQENFSRHQAWKSLLECVLHKSGGVMATPHG